MKVIVYTANINGYDKDQNHEFKDSYDYKIIKEESELPTLRAREIKLTKYPKRCISVWIDSNFNQQKSIELIVNEFIKSGADMAVMKHPYRSTVREEAQACIQRRKDNSVKITRQLDRYNKEGFQMWGLLAETGFMIRRDNAKIRNMMNDWYKEVEKESIRDQLSFNYSLSKNRGVKVMYLDADQIKTKYFTLTKH